VLLAELYVDVRRALVQRHIRDRPACEGIEGSRITRVARTHEICCGNYGEDLLDGCIGYCRALVLARNSRGRDGQALMLPKAFVCQEEKDLIFLDGATTASSEIVALKRGLWIGRAGGCEPRIEVVPGIQCVVAEELKQFRMVFICARAGCEIDD